MEKANRLPKYWVVKNDGSEKFKDTVLKYLKDVHNEPWLGIDTYSYYGYDGGNCFQGTNTYGSVSDFQNSPTLLTLKKFIELTSEEEFVEGEVIEVRDTEKHN